MLTDRTHDVVNARFNIHCSTYGIQIRRAFFKHSRPYRSFTYSERSTVSAAVGGCSQLIHKRVKESHIEPFFATSPINGSIKWVI